MSLVIKQVIISVLRHQDSLFLMLVPCKFKWDVHSNHNKQFQTNKKTFPLVKQFCCSINNCSCPTSKAGIILYPKDIRTKNMVLLVCQQCYSYNSNSDIPSHGQLEKWYFNIYRDSTSFRSKSYFIQNEDGSLDFDCLPLDSNEPYNITYVEMEALEKQMVRRVIQGKQDKNPM